MVMYEEDGKYERVFHNIMYDGSAARWTGTAGTVRIHPLYQAVPVNFVSFYCR